MKRKKKKEQLSYTCMMDSHTIVCNWTYVSRCCFSYWTTVVYQIWLCDPTAGLHFQLSGL